MQDSRLSNQESVYVTIHCLYVHTSLISDMQHCTLEVLMANAIPVLESDQWMALLPVGSSQVYSTDSPGARKVLRSFLLQRNEHCTCEFLKSSYVHEHLQCSGHIEAVVTLKQ